MTRARPPFGAARHLLSSQATRMLLLALGLNNRRCNRVLPSGVARARLTHPGRGRLLARLRHRRRHSCHLGSPRACPVVIGVIAATIAANIVGDRSIWASIFKGFCNAGDAALTAWLIEQWFDGPFAFDDVRHVLGFVAAAGLGAAASAIAGAATVILFHAPLPFWDVWRAWFLSDGVGTVVLAPPVIGLGQLWRELPSQADSIEGVGVLTLFMPVNIYSAVQPSGGWATYDADAAVFPLLLWLTARCHPIFAIVAAFIWSITVIWATIFGVGQFGDASVPLSERVEGAQISVTIVTFCTLILSALFTERRRNEAVLRLALAELDHRVKNMLATVLAIVARTRKPAAQSLSLSPRSTAILDRWPPPMSC